MCERELETEQNCNILTPTLLAQTAFLSRSPGLLNRGPGGPTSLGHVPHSSIFSPTRLIPNCSIGGLRAPSAGCCLSLPHLVSNSDLISCALSYIIVHVHLLVSVTNCTHSTHPRSRLHSAIPRPDAPVIYTGAFHILTARPSCRSICNSPSWLQSPLFSRFLFLSFFSTIFLK